MVLVASLNELSCPSSPSGLLHGLDRSIHGSRSLVIGSDWEPTDVHFLTITDFTV